jgi:hypothetical protein
MSRRAEGKKIHWAVRTRRRITSILASLSLADEAGAETLNVQSNLLLPYTLCFASNSFGIPCLLEYTVH